MTDPADPDRPSRPGEGTAGGYAGAPPPDSGGEPATADDIRSLRRWVWVAGIWAAAASVIALLALFAGDDNSTPDGSQGARVEALQDRVDDLEREVSAPQTDNDVDDLRNRVEDVEKTLTDVQGNVEDANDAGRQVTELENRLDELDARLDDLESQSNGGN